MTVVTCGIEKENKDSFKVEIGNVQGINIVGTVLLPLANPHCLQVRQYNRVSYGISIQTACHLISSWQFLWTNHSENESAWIWCTATVANADCNACWVADIYFLFCLVHIIGTQQDVFEERLYNSRGESHPLPRALLSLFYI